MATIATRTVNVSKFREQIDFLGYAITGVAACVGDAERTRGVESVARRAAELRAMECPRGKDDDFARAARMVARADEIVSAGHYLPATMAE